MGKHTSSDSTKFNVFDILIVVMIIACIAAIGLRFYFISNVDMTSESVSVKFEVVGISDENANEFKDGKKLYLQNSDNEVGRITSISIDQMKVRASDESGALIILDHPDKKTVTGTATFNGKWNEKGFMLGGTQLISLGTVIDLYTDRNQFSMTVIEVYENQAEY